MIGWVIPVLEIPAVPVLRAARPKIFRVLCWYKASDGVIYVATTREAIWRMGSVTVLDTEAEVVALLLQGYEMAEPTADTSIALRWLRGQLKSYWEDQR